MGTQQRIGIIEYTTMKTAVARMEEEEERLFNVSVKVDTIL